MTVMMKMTRMRLLQETPLGLRQERRLEMRLLEMRRLEMRPLEMRLLKMRLPRIQVQGLAAAVLRAQESRMCFPCKNAVEIGQFSEFKVLQPSEGHSYSGIINTNSSNDC